MTKTLQYIKQLLLEKRSKKYVIGVINVLIAEAQKQEKK